MTSCRFPDTRSGRPYLDKITFLFYPDDATMEKAFDARQIDAIAGITPTRPPHRSRAPTQTSSKSPLPRVFGVFFNQSHNAVLADASVRAALERRRRQAEHRRHRLDGYGVTLDGPIPPGVLGDVSPETPVPLSAVPGQEATDPNPEAASASSSAAGNGTSTASASSDASSTPVLTDESSYADAARSILEKGGWTFSATDGVGERQGTSLSFTLSTADEPELVATADAVAGFWAAAGIKATVQVYPLSDLNTNVIAPARLRRRPLRRGRRPELDLYAFWHSSQRNDPGLNLAMYANETTDALLSQARATSDEQARDALYQSSLRTSRRTSPRSSCTRPTFCI